MKKTHWLFIFLLILLVSCQSTSVPVTIIIEDERIYFNTRGRVPIEILSDAAIELGGDDRIIYLGSSVSRDAPLPESNSYTLIVRRAFDVILVSPDNTQTITTSAITVGQALVENSIQLTPADYLDPPATTSLTAGMIIKWRPAINLVINVDGDKIHIKSSAGSIGQALAETGIPLVGLDYSIPSALSPLPPNGEISIVRVFETVTLTQNALPFITRFEPSAGLELDQQEILHPGESGLSVSRVRIRIEDGNEVGRQDDEETIVRQGQDRIIGYGTKVVIRDTTVDGVTITYWRAVQVYATSYSPCRSGVSTCYYYTSSREKVQQGVIAVASRWYPYIVGTGVFIPGYGYATVEDIGGGFPDRYWIDLAYSDEAYISWGDWVTLYFLTPVPPVIQYVLPYR